MFWNRQFELNKFFTTPSYTLLSMFFNRLLRRRTKKKKSMSWMGMNWRKFGSLRASFNSPAKGNSRHILRRLRDPLPAVAIYTLMLFLSCLKRLCFCPSRNTPPLIYLIDLVSLIGLIGLISLRFLKWAWGYSPYGGFDLIILSQSLPSLPLSRPNATVLCRERSL